MPIISLSFFTFFIVVLVIYYLLPGKAQWMWLFCVSALLYSYNTSIEKTLIFILFLLINWVAGVLISKYPNHKKFFFKSVIVFDITFISVFKYSSFFFGVLKSLGLSGFSMSFDSFSFTLNNLAPPHVSYFVLIICGYLTDVYWSRCEAQYNPCKFILFGGFFPIMTAGPIVRYEKMSIQLFGQKNHFNYNTFICGIQRILWGLFKKLVISSRCAVIANTIYDNYLIYPGFYIPVGVIFYVFQLYTDFSGLMDIVIGASKCLSIELPENFKTPFFSRSISEFWRRWHITLGQFLKDYVLFSLQRSGFYKKSREICKKYLGKDYKKKYNIPAYLTLFVSWFIIGLWHGGGWKYIFGVGLYMWLIIVLGDILKPLFEKAVKTLKINTECESYKLFLQLRTFCLYIFGVSFFRAQTLSEGFSLWKSYLSLFNPWIFFDASLFNLGLDRREFGIMIFGLALVLLTSYISYSKDICITDWMMRQNYIFRLLICVFIFSLTIVFGDYGSQYNASDFIYGQF